MRCKERKRPDAGWPRAISWGLVLPGLLLPALARDPRDSRQSAPLQQTLAIVQDCMASTPAPWPDTWQREYLDAIRQALNNDANQADYAPRIEVFRRGFARYWAKSPVAGLTQTEFDLRKAEIRWYCETLRAEEPASPSEKVVLKAQLRDLCDYAAQYLNGRFPFLKPECVEEAKKAALAEFEQEVESPLLPIFRRPLSEDQLRATKARWARLYRRWHFIWRGVRYGGRGGGDLSDPGNLTSHSHYRFARRCLTYLPRTLWPTVPKPPGYVLEVITKLNAEKAERARLTRKGVHAEREVAMRCSNQIEQVEEWSFVFTALLETASTDHGQACSLANSREGGDAYDLKKQP